MVWHYPRKIYIYYIYTHKNSCSLDNYVGSLHSPIKLNTAILAVSNLHDFSVPVSVRNYIVYHKNTLANKKITSIQTETELQERKEKHPALKLSIRQSLVHHEMNLSKTMKIMRILCNHL